MKLSVGQEFTCKCGKMKGWIYDGVKKTEPCPICGRLYKGVYNKKTYQIDAVEIKHKEANR